MNRQQGEGDEEELTEKLQHKKNGGQFPCGCQIFLLKYKQRSSSQVKSSQVKS
jgi:hypothetical protein